MYRLMKRYRYCFKYSSGSPFSLSLSIAVCKCIENEILASLYFSDLYHNRQYHQNSVTAKYMYNEVFYSKHYKKSRLWTLQICYYKENKLRAFPNSENSDHSAFSHSPFAPAIYIFTIYSLLSSLRVICRSFVCALCDGYCMVCPRVWRKSTGFGEVIIDRTDLKK